MCLLNTLLLIIERKWLKIIINHSKRWFNYKVGSGCCKGMSKKKKNLKEYCRIKVVTKCLFLRDLM